MTYDSVTYHIIRHYSNLSFAYYFIVIIVIVSSSSSSSSIISSSIIIISSNSSSSSIIIFTLPEITISYCSIDTSSRWATTLAFACVVFTNRVCVYIYIYI